MMLPAQEPAPVGFRLLLCSQYQARQWLGLALHRQGSWQPVRIRSKQFEAGVSFFYSSRVSEFFNIPLIPFLAKYNNHLISLPEIKFLEAGGVLALSSPSV
jgi:hypothetical protein